MKGGRNMNLQDKINEECLTIAELARRTKVSRVTIYRALQGQEVRNDSWAKFAKYFKCKIEDLRGK